MKVPKTFELGCRTWRVKFKDLGSHWGYCRQNRAVIELNEKLKKPGREDLLLHSFMHELLHATSTTIGWRRVDEDEHRLDALAGALAQALKTAT